jgi:hypothetical protein
MGQAAAEQPIDVRPLTLLTGAEVHGVDLSKPLSEPTVAAICAALLRWKVVFFRDQQLGHAEQIALAARFGELTYAYPNGTEQLLPVDTERVLYRVTLSGDVPVGVGGRRSRAVIGDPFGAGRLPRLAAQQNHPDAQTEVRA